MVGQNIAAPVIVINYRHNDFICLAMEKRDRVWGKVDNDKADWEKSLNLTCVNSDISNYIGISYAMRKHRLCCILRCVSGEVTEVEMGTQKAHIAWVTCFIVNTCFRTFQ